VDITRKLFHVVLRLLRSCILVGFVGVLVLALIRIPAVVRIRDE
jgi:hypothetical protein